jgi:hypothetical protein
MNDQKPYKQLLKETFTKTLGERYAESSGKDKIIYWAFIAIVYSIIGYFLIKIFG